MQRFSQRIEKAVAVSIKYGSNFTRDITRSHTQPEAVLEREVYLDAPKELYMADGIVIRVIKQQFGIPESG